MFLNIKKMAKKVAEAKKETSKVEEVKVPKIKEVGKVEIQTIVPPTEFKLKTDGNLGLEESSPSQKLEVSEPKKVRDIDEIIGEFVPVLTINNLLKIQVIEAIKEGKPKEEIVFLLDSIDTFDKHRIETVKNLL
jgi:hypothetical protein